MSAVDVKVFLEGYEIDRHYIQSVSIVQAVNSLNRASITLTLPPAKLPFEIRKDGPIDVLIVADGKILFQGLVMSQVQNKTPQGGSVTLEAISSFSLLQTLRIGLLSPTLNPANIPSIWIAQMGGTLFVPGYLQRGEKGAVAYDVMSLIYGLVNRIKQRIDSKGIPLEAQRPIATFLESLLKLGDEYWETTAIDYGGACRGSKTATPNKIGVRLEGKEWWDKVNNIYRLADRIAEYSPFTAAAIRFFFPSNNLAEIVHAIFQGAMFSGQSVVASLHDILFALLGYMLLNFIEVSTPQGIALVPKPRLLSALPPKSNILPAYTISGFSLSIADAQVPTRTIVVPLNMAIPGADPTVLRTASASYMVGYPEEIERKALLKGLEIMEKSGLIQKADPNMPLPDLARKYYTSGCSLPKPLMAVISEEEKKRGVIPNTVQVPQQLQALVDQFLSRSSVFKAWLTLYGWAAYNHLTVEGQARRAQVQGAFNPWALVDHTVVFSDGNQIYMGHAEEIVHTITPMGATTTYLLSHARVITEDLLAHVSGEKENTPKTQRGEVSEFGYDPEEFFGEDFTVFDLTVGDGIDDLRTPNYGDLMDYHRRVFGIDYTDDYGDRYIANVLLDTGKSVDFAYTKLWPRDMAEDIVKAMEQIDYSVDAIQKISNIIDRKWL